jgi:hypothetical protein
MEHGVSMDHPFWDVAAAATREWQRLGVTPQRVAFAVRSVALYRRLSFHFVSIAEDSSCYWGFSCPWQIPRHRSRSGRSLRPSHSDADRIGAQPAEPVGACSPSRERCRHLLSLAHGPKHRIPYLRGRADFGKTNSKYLDESTRWSRDQHANQRFAT